MTFPNLQGKHAYDAMVTPAEIHAEGRAAGRLPDFSNAAGMIFCYQDRLVDLILDREPHEQLLRVMGPGVCCRLGTDPGQPWVGICGKFGVGAPVATIALEAGIALGLRRFMSIGTAGCLQRGVAIGDLVLCTEAIRDEGVSHHYLPAEARALPSPGLTERLRQALVETGATLHAGPSWTIDAPFRETVEEARHYQSLGVQTVEMEASALFAVAAYRRVEIASAFVVSDSLAELTWQPRFSDPSVIGGLEKLFDAARSVLLAG